MTPNPKTLDATRLVEVAGRRHELAKTGTERLLDLRVALGLAALTAGAGLLGTEALNAILRPHLGWAGSLFVDFLFNALLLCAVTGILLGQEARLFGRTLADLDHSERAMRALHESEERYRALGEASKDSITIYDRAGNILYINPQASLRYSKPREQIEGRNLSEVMPEKAANLGKVYIESVIASGVPRFEEIPVAYPSGEIHCSVWMVPLKDTDGVYRSAMSVSRDITDRVHAVEALQQSLDALESRVAERTAELASANGALKQEVADRLAAMEALAVARVEADRANQAKSEFLSSMSHELRTPLNAILGFAQILDMEQEDPGAKECTSHILRGGRHLLALINEVLDITRVETGHLELSTEAIGLDDVVPEACALMQPLADGRGIRILGDVLLPTGQYVLADRQRFKQVLLNLLSNAIKYNREAGTVEVSRQDTADGRIRIAVRDTGPGISPEDLAKLFKPFERLGATNSNIEGTGLGLVLSQRLMSAMGGSLEVVSQVGVGTTFFLDLPETVSPENLAGLDEAGSILAPGEAGEPIYSVLCVEDNPSNLKLFEMIFKNLPSIKLMTAIQGSVGLDLARQHLPDLILLDLNLPDINGKEVLDRLRQTPATAKIPVIIVSADATPKRIEILLQSGAQAFLTKPINVQELLRTVRKHLPELT